MKYVLRSADLRKADACYRRKYVSRDMTKPTKWMCAQRRLSLDIRPVWSESSLSAWRKLGSLVPIKPTARTLIRLGGCPGWSESSLGAQSLCWFCHVARLMYTLSTGLPRNNVRKLSETSWNIQHIHCVYLIWFKHIYFRNISYRHAINI